MMPIFTVFNRVHGRQLLIVTGDSILVNTEFKGILFHSVL